MEGNHKAMTHLRNGLKKMACRRIRLVLPAVLALVLFAHHDGRAAPEPAPVPQGRGDLLNNSLIERVIPSKPEDLFVVMKNGLTLLVRESPGSGVVSTQVLVRTGSIYEGERIPGGLSHYLEHVVSGGTTSDLTESQIKERLQAMGGASNAYTSYEHTVYFIKTTRPHYLEALSLLLSYVTDCRFDETEYEREKGVILQEYQMGENDPSRQLWHLFMKTAYGSHPVRYPIIGEREVFLGMGKEDLTAHYRRWYSPENLVVSVVGDVDRESVLGAVLDLAGSLKRAARAPYVLPVEPAQLAERRVEKSLPIARMTQAQMGFRTVRLTDPDLYALDVLAVILGDGRTSGLYEALRHDRELVQSISASSWTPVFTEGQFLISMDLRYESLSDAIDAVWGELLSAQETPVTPEVLQRAKNKVVADFVFSQEKVQSQATQLASDWVATSDPYFSEKYVASVQAVGSEDILRVAGKYLKKDRMTLAVVKPVQDKSGAEKMKTRSLQSAAEIERIVLPNEMTLLLKRSTAAPIVALSFVVQGGLRFEPADQPGLSSFMASLLTKGTKNRSKMELAKALEDVGGSIHSGSGNNTVIISLLVLKEHLDVALDVLSDVVRHPTFPEMEIEKQRKETLLAIERLDEGWTTEITRLFKKHYYRKHPYRNDVIGTVDAVKGFSREDIVRFYGSVMMPNNAVLAVFGDVDPHDVTTRVQAAFEGFEPGILKLPTIEVETRNIVRDEEFEVFNEKTSAAILVGYNGLALGDRDRPAVDVLDAIVSGIGYPSGWLHDALRGGDKSLVYVVHAYPAFGVDGAYFGVMAQTTEDHYDEVRDTILDKMALIQKSAVDAKTLQRAKSMCVSSHEMAMEGIAAQASSAAVNEALGLGFDYDRVYPERIGDVTAEEVLQVATDLFSNHLITATKPK
jgi:zinc protease